MSNVPGCGLTEIGVDTVICDLHYSDPQNDVDNEVKGFPSGMFGYVKHLDGTPWSWGLGVYAPAGFSAEFDMVNPVTGPARYKSLGVLGKVLPGISYQVNERLSIGAAVGVGIGQVELEGPFFVQTGPLAGAPTLLDLQATDATVVGNIGLQYAITPRTTLGVAYTEESRFVFDGTIGCHLIHAVRSRRVGFRYTSRFSLAAFAGRRIEARGRRLSSFWRGRHLVRLVARV